MRKHRRRHHMHNGQRNHEKRSPFNVVCGEGSVTLPLSMVQEGELVRIISFRGGRGLQNRLAALGLTPGAEIIKIKDNHAGPAIIRVKDSRLALGRGMMHYIDVDYVHKQSSGE